MGTPTNGPTMGTGEPGPCTIQRARQGFTAEADCAAALDLDLWIPRISDVEQLTIEVWTRWVLMDVHHTRNGTRTMADVILNHRARRHSPPPTMECPSQWRYVVTQIGVCAGHDLNRLHWRWHHRVALIQHNIRTIQTPLPREPASPDRATGNQLEQSPTNQGPPRQVTRTSHSQSPHRRPTGVADPCDQHRSPLRLFAHPWPDHGDQRAPLVQPGKTPIGHRHRCRNTEPAKPYYVGCPRE